MEHVFQWEPSWWTWKNMGYRRIWVMTVMDHDRVDCILCNVGVRVC